MALTLPGEVILSSAMEAGKFLIDRFFPDPQKKAEAELELYKFTVENQNKWMDRLASSDANQAAINQAEAESDNIFKSGWRPALGWVCVTAFSVKFALFPLLSVILPLFSIVFVVPVFELGELVTLLFGMLGLAGLRSWDKKQGTA